MPLMVPHYRQETRVSCTAAAVRMILAFLVVSCKSTTLVLINIR